MSNIDRKIANENHEDGGRLSTRSVSRHGLSKATKYYKKYYNRVGKRGAKKLAFKDEG